jgi:hypothetical protein
MSTNYCQKDREMSEVACEMGFGTGVFPELKLTHLIPKERTSIHWRSDPPARPRDRWRHRARGVDLTLLGWAVREGRNLKARPMRSPRLSAIGFDCRASCHAILQRARKKHRANLCELRQH